MEQLGCRDVRQGGSFVRRFWYDVESAGHACTSTGKAVKDRSIIQLVLEIDIAFLIIFNCEN